MNANTQLVNSELCSLIKSVTEETPTESSIIANLHVKNVKRND